MLFILLLLLPAFYFAHTDATPKAIDVIQSAGQLDEHQPNFCNRTDLSLENGLQKTSLGQFLGYPCSADFYHCRWQSDGYRTYKKSCRVGLVFDTTGTQNCNYDYNVKGCAITSNPEKCSNATDFACPLSEHCVSLGQRCDGVYDCVLEEDEQNCPMCKQEEFPCVTSEQCVPMSARCNGFPECKDGTDEHDCEVCPADNFFCRKSQKCIPAAERCDGVNQCPYGEDEQLCKKVGNQMYVCENRQTQVPRELVCNGKPDCPDASDEKYCLHPAPTAPLIGEKSIEENTVSENIDPAQQLNAIQAQPGEPPAPINSDKAPTGTGKLAFPRINFNGHSEEGQQEASQQMDSSPATVQVVSDGNEATGRLIGSSESTVAEPEATTDEPYLAPVTDAKPMMHMMKKYRPPGEKYTTDCGGVVQIDKQQETQQSEYKPPPTTLCPNQYPQPQPTLDRSACPPIPECPPCQPCVPVQQEVVDYVGQQGRRQFTQPTTVNLFRAETPQPPRQVNQAVKTKIDPLQELSLRYGTSRNELLKKIEQILRNETAQTQEVVAQSPPSGSMFAPPGPPLTTEPPFHKLSKAIHVTGRPHKWQPSLSTNNQKPPTTTPKSSFRAYKSSQQRRTQKFH
ncbi:Chitin-binding type-2 domain-containing protein [Aphelenchoides bicaudatus]|nr:Chitin-binding type-2 domain-containing protein [Aphelenchoides bicaudatus]